MESVLRNRRAAMKGGRRLRFQMRPISPSNFTTGRVGPGCASMWADPVGVRTKIGKTLRGWQACGAGAYEPEGRAPSFWSTDTPRIQTRPTHEGGGLPVAAGIEGMRAILSRAREHRPAGRPVWRRQDAARQACSMLGAAHSPR